MTIEPVTNTTYIIMGLILAFVATFAAVLGPYLADRVKARFLAPELKILWEQVSPHCIKTFFGDPPFTEDRAVYYFRFQFSNEGKTQARICEAVLEKLWTYDKAGNAKEYPDFAPRTLGLETDRPLEPVGINPHRKVYCAIGHISCPEWQANHERGKLQDIRGNRDPSSLRFSLEGKAITHGQPSWLVPGNYAIQVTLYAENASTKTGFFKIAWSGRWQSDPLTMFNECVIQYSQTMP